MKTRHITLSALFVALIAICSWISIPAAVPFTFQTFAVFLAIGVLGGKRGALAIAAYLLLGALGVPVFANFSGGIGALLGSTGGYLIGFLAAALVVWGTTHLLGEGAGKLLLGMVFGLMVLYAFGTVWFIVIYVRNNGTVALMTVLSWCVFPFVLPDVVKVVLAALIAKRLHRAMNIRK